MSLALVMGSAAPAAEAARPSPGRTISFAGYTWTVKSGAGRVGPGPNYFSSSTDNVWVDARGLHLRITYRNGRWNCAEVILQGSFGYKTYTWVLDSPVDALNENVVLGLFTWHDRPPYAHRELDLEWARWGNPSDPTNAQYVVQPWDQPGHLARFTQPAGAVPSVHAFTWSASSVRFSSARGTSLPSAPADAISSWTFTGEVPKPGGENPRMNLWLYGGSAPSDGAEIEVVISGFRIT